MSINEAPATLRDVFYRYCLYGSDSHEIKESALGLDSRNFIKLFRDSSITDYVKAHDLDLIFIKSKEQAGNSSGNITSKNSNTIQSKYKHNQTTTLIKKRKLKFSDFKIAVTMLAAKLDMPKKALSDYLIQATATGPGNNGGTVAKPQKFHDDESTYTGVHKNGGPTSVDSHSMDRLVNRQYKPSKTLRHQLLQNNGRGNAQNINSANTHQQFDNKLRMNTTISSLDSSSNTVSRSSPPGKEFHCTVTPIYNEIDMNDAETPMVRLENQDNSNQFQSLVPGLHTKSEHGPLHEIFVLYCAGNSQSISDARSLGAPSSHAVSVRTQDGKSKNIVPLLDSFKFSKLCKDANLMEEKGMGGLRYHDLDLIFLKSKGKSPMKYQAYGKVGNSAARKLDWTAFKHALAFIATKLGITPSELEHYLVIVLQNGPRNSGGTLALPNRFHDEKDAYTGVHRNGGPITVETEKLGLHLHVDRRYKRDNNLREKLRDNKSSQYNRQIDSNKVEETGCDIFRQKVRSVINTTTYQGDNYNDQGASDPNWKSVFQFGVPIDHPSSMDVNRDSKGPRTNVDFSRLASAATKSTAAKVVQQQKLADYNNRDGNGMDEFENKDDDDGNDNNYDDTTFNNEEISINNNNNNNNNRYHNMEVAKEQEGDTTSKLLSLEHHERLVYIFSEVAGGPQGSLDSNQWIELCKMCGVLSDKDVEHEGQSTIRPHDCITIFMRAKKNAGFGARRMELEDFLLVAIPNLATTMNVDLDLLSQNMLEMYISEMMNGYNGSLSQNNSPRPSRHFTSKSRDRTSSEENRRTTNDGRGEREREREGKRSSFDVVSFAKAAEDAIIKAIDPNLDNSSTESY